MYQRPNDEIEIFKCFIVKYYLLVGQVNFSQHYPTFLIKDESILYDSRTAKLTIETNGKEHYEKQFEA